MSVLKAASHLVDSWLLRGHKIAGDTSKRRVIEDVYKTLKNIGEADAVLIVSLRKKEEEGKYSLLTNYLGPLVDECALDMVSATKDVSQRLLIHAYNTDKERVECYLKKDVEDGC